jgi:hypothetical protein
VTSCRMHTSSFLLFFQASRLEHRLRDLESTGCSSRMSLESLPNTPRLSASTEAFPSLVASEPKPKPYEAWTLPAQYSTPALNSIGTRSIQDLMLSHSRLSIDSESDSCIRSSEPTILIDACSRSSRESVLSSTASASQDYPPVPPRMRAHSAIPDIKWSAARGDKQFTSRSATLTQRPLPALPRLAIDAKWMFSDYYFGSVSRRVSLFALCGRSRLTHCSMCMHLNLRRPRHCCQDNRLARFLSAMLKVTKASRYRFC